MHGRLFHYYTEGFPSRKIYPASVRGTIRYLHSLITLWPEGLQRIMKLQPFFSLATSLLVIFLFQKGFEYVPLAIVSTIFAFFYITFRLYLLKEKKGVITSLWDTALIFIINNMLLFILPFYFESMTIPSRNMLFAPLILGLAIIAGWFTLYQRFIVEHPMRSSLFYALTFFCVLNFLLPVLFGIRNIWSLLIAGGIAAAAVLIFVYPHIDLLKNRKNTIVFITGICLFFIFLWLGRSLVPPSPLKLTRATACRAIELYKPVEPFSRSSLSSVAEVYFYSSIFAPRGLKEKIDHVWYHNGKCLFTVSLSEIRGGRKQGFGTWSRHTILEGPGKYTVEVWTSGGQLLGKGYFYLN
jgi:hypothetical protein